MCGALAPTLGALVLAGCGGSGGGAAGSGGAASSGGATELAAIKRAAYVSDRVPGYRFDLDTTTKVGSEDFKVSGEGALDEGESNGSMSLSIKGQTIREVIDKPYVYLELPSGSSTGTTGGKRWARTNLPLEVWIDGDSRVRRMSLQMHLCSRVGDIEESLTMELHDFGPQPGGGGAAGVAGVRHRQQAGRSSAQGALRAALLSRCPGAARCGKLAPR
ncbi:MAG TPA: hypothetical protein VHW67_06895 [Solirubrobacteraceae bacterium]|nr:hypothetical protein [Solirubrobacteraceae bacterium]